MNTNLIRITTEDNDSRFDGTINADLVLNPGSEIALKSLYIEKENDLISIRQGQNTVTYNFNDNAVVANLATAEYDNNNFQSLLDDIESKLNNSIGYDATVYNTAAALKLGMDFQVAINEDLKVQIEQGKANIGPQADLFQAGASDDITTAEETGAAPNGVTSDVWYVDDPITDGKGRVMKLDDHLPNGIGYLEAMLWKVAHNAVPDADANSFYLCFSTIDLADATTEEIENNLDNYLRAGVGIATTAANYEIISLVGTTATSIATVVDPIVEGQNENMRIRLLRNGNDIQYIYKDNATGDMIVGDITTLQTNQRVWPFVVFFSNKDYIKLAQVQCAISHFSRETTTPAVKLENPVVDAAARPFQSTYTPAKGWQSSSGWVDIPLYISTNNSLVFQNITLARFLGYDFTAHPRAGTVRNINFSAPAQVKFGPRIAVDELIVLTENLELNSYDTFVSQRKNILEIVGVDTSNDGKVVYNADFPNFISLKNKEPVILRNLLFRIVEKDYSTMKLFGQAAIVVLVRSPK